MKLSKPKNWNDIPAFSGELSENITPGGHYLQILAVKERSGSDWQALEVFFDCHSTDHQAGIVTAKYNYNKQFRPDSNWPGMGRKLVYLPQEDDPKSGRALKAFITALEASNSGFTFNFDAEVEPQLKNKTIGGVFREREYEFEGNAGMTVELAFWCDAEKVPDQKVPKPRMLDKTRTLPAPTASEDLPFDL